MGAGTVATLGLSSEGEQLRHTHTQQSKGGTTMCGIFGYQIQEQAAQAGVVADWQVKVLASTLGLLNDERGGHSWGLTTSAGGRITVEKGLGDISKLSADKIAQSTAVMGHTRWASTGDITIANAHPFDVGVLIGAHNGVVGNHQDLNQRYNRACAVDSQHIFLHLAEDRPLTELEVWGAIQFVKPAMPESFYVGAFPTGDLAIAGLGTYAQPHGVVWSSDQRHLVRALTIAGLAHFLYDVQPTRLYCVKDGIVWDGPPTLQAQENRAFLDRPRHAKMSSRAQTQQTERDRYDDGDWWASLNEDERCDVCDVELTSYTQIQVDGLLLCRGCEYGLNN